MVLLCLVLLLQQRQLIPSVMALAATNSSQNFTALRQQFVPGTEGLGSYYRCGTYCENPVIVGNGNFPSSVLLSRRATLG